MLSVLLKTPCGISAPLSYALNFFKHLSEANAMLLVFIYTDVLLVDSSSKARSERKELKLKTLLLIWKRVMCYRERG